MASATAKSQWIHDVETDFHEKTKDDDTNCYIDVDASRFPLRGKNYLSDRKKFPSEEAAFKLVCSKCFRTDYKLPNAVDSIDSLQKFLDDNSDKEYFIQTWLVPGHFTVVSLYERTLERGKDAVFDRLYDKFRYGDPIFQKERFKFIPEIIDAPWAIKKTVQILSGSIRPVLLSKRLKTSFHNGKNYFEVSVDTGSSYAVGMAASTMVKSFAKIVANLSFLVEGRDEQELPERVIAAHSFSKVDVKSVGIRLLKISSSTSCSSTET
uniref:Protein ENHANCED DISEASE RESISTANCE 2 C-terminal domain-containing protein n=1 Tax=Lotharella globosa TaxID=91324 RepID=A0A6V3UJ17_9EUKA